MSVKRTIVYHSSQVLQNRLDFLGNLIVLKPQYLLAIVKQYILIH